jgi:hypothetical protein
MAALSCLFTQALWSQGRACKALLDVSTLCVLPACLLGVTFHPGARLSYSSVAACGCEHTGHSLCYTL